MPVTNKKIRYTDKENIIKTIQTDRPVQKAGKKMSGKNKETLSSIYESSLSDKKKKKRRGQNGKKAQA